MKQLYLLDGSGFIFRAYHGLNELTDTQGRNINALYGFVRMLMKLLEQWPDYFIVCRDSPKPTFRKQEFDGYKAQRPSLDDNFKRQISQIKICIDQLHIPTRELAWYEADDLIASIIHQYQSDSFLHFTIVSGDKDLKQLISSQVTHYDQMKEVKTTPTQFVQEYWFEPHQLLDYLSLLGDNSDNIPGVHGIGEKTAKSLIRQYGNLDTIYQCINHISPILQTKLIAGKESAYQSQHLIRLYHAPEEMIQSLAHYQFKPNYDLMYKVLVRDYQMNSLQKAITALQKALLAPKQTSLFF